MEDALVDTNLSYSGSEDANLRMDVYRPSGNPDGATSPIILLVHGGAGADLRPKDWGVFRSWGRLLAASGMVAAVFTHRLAPPPNSLLAEAASDLNDAIYFVRKNALKWNADPDRVCVMVWSAGGPLMTGLLREKPSWLRCVVGLYPLLDLQQYAPGAPPEVGAFLRSFSPISCMGEGGALPPVFVARAGRDSIPLLNDALDRFVSAALVANACITLVNHPDGAHGFDNQNDDERTREILRSALEFTRHHLRV
jgi:acetyl esterase/lipase